jgi:hypothetical protein
LVTFFWRSKRKLLAAGNPGPGTQNTSAPETTKGFDKLSPNGEGLWRMPGAPRQQAYAKSAPPEQEPAQKPCTYNHSVPHHPSPRLTLSTWERLATWLSFLAVAAALWAPVSMLAQDVRTGKLGGICSVNTFDAASVDGSTPADGDAAQSGMRCDLCGSLALVLPALPEAAVPCFAGNQVATADFPAATSAAIPGLPFSRGPPAL